MKRLVLILWLLPVLALPAHYRFDLGESYNLNGVETACDTMYLQWIYDGDTSATHVLTSPALGRTGYYLFDSTVAEAGRYTILMEFVDNSESVRFLHEEFFEAKDTVSDSVVVDGSAFASLEGIIDSASYDSSSMDGFYAVRFLAGDDLVDSVEVGIDNKFTFVGDSVLATAGAGSDTSAIKTMIEGKFLFDGDSVITDQSTMVVLGDTNNSLYTAALAATTVWNAAYAPTREITGALNPIPVDYDSIADIVFDTMYVHADAFKDGESGGEYQVIICAYDTAASTVLMDAEITVFNQADNSQRWVVNANANGLATFALDADTFTVIGSGTREMAETDTIIVTDDMTDTLLFWSTVVSAAGNPNLCAVYGILCKPDGTRLSNAQVRFSLSSAVTDTSNGTSISNYDVVGQSNDTGYVKVDLIKNGNCIPDSHFEAEIKKSDIVPIRYEFFIPADSTKFEFTTGGSLK